MLRNINTKIEEVLFCEWFNSNKNPNYDPNLVCYRNVNANTEAEFTSKKSDNKKHKIMDINKFIITHPNWDKINPEYLHTLFNNKKKNFKQHSLYIDIDDVQPKSKQCLDLIIYTKKLYNMRDEFKEIYDEFALYLR